MKTFETYKKWMNEKFIQDSDPIRDMGIGVFHKRNFKNIEEAAKFIVECLPSILKTKKIPFDFLHGGSYYFKFKYFNPIDNYIEKYITIKGVKQKENMYTEIYEEITHILKKT